MHYADIYAAMVKAGWPPSRVAAHLRVERSAVSQVIRNTCRSYNIASFISSVTGLPLKRMFPGGAYDKAPKSGAEIVRQKGVAA